MAKAQKVVNGVKLDPRTSLDYYTKSAIGSGEWTDVEIRREYSRLRDIAQKRLQTLARHEPGSFAYRKNVGAYPILKEAGTEGARALLPQLARFIAAKTGTVKGIREQRNKALESLHEHGYTFLNKGNIRQFGEFMEAYRANKEIERVVGSPAIVDLFEAVTERHINVEQIKEQFALWIEALPDLQQIPPIPTKQKVDRNTGEVIEMRASAADYQKAVNQLRKERGQQPLRKKPRQKKRR